MKCVVNFASGQQSQTELRLYFGVCILQKFQQSSHRDGRFAFGGYSLRAGTFLFGVETFLKLLAQFYTGGLLDMSVGVHQHIRRGVSCGALNGLSHHRRRSSADRWQRNVPMPSAASKSRSSGVRPTISPSHSAPTSVRWTAKCRMGSSMLSSAARISSTVQMVRSCVDFLGQSTGEQGF